MIKRGPPKIWRGRIVEKGGWVFGVPNLRFREWFSILIGSAILLSIGIRFFG